MNEHFNWFTILIIFASLQGIFLFVSIYRSKGKDFSANKFLALFLLFASLTLFGRFFFTQERFSLVELKLLFVGDLIIYTFGPLLYIYFLRLFKISVKTPHIVHFISAILYFIFALPFLFGTESQFHSYLNQVSFTFHYWEVLAIIINLFYVIITWKMLQNVIHSNEKFLSYSNNVKFYKSILIVIFIAIVAWIFSFIFVEISKGNYLGYHLVWIIISGALISLGYYAISKPEIFVIPEIEEENDVNGKISPEIEEIGKKVLTIMEEDKPFLDPKLTLGKLARIVGVNSHLLSKTINENFGRNFFLFVNDYRVKEFKLLASKRERENYTLLTLAYDSGFNSKTTFNTAFKKITNQTPKQYLNEVNT